MVFSSGGLLCFLPPYCCTHHYWFLLGARCWRIDVGEWRMGKKTRSACRYPSRVCPRVCSLLTVCHVDSFWEKKPNKPLKPKQTNWKTVSLTLISPWPCHDVFSYWLFVPFYIFLHHTGSLPFTSLANNMPKLFIFVCISLSSECNSWKNLIWYLWYFSYKKY